jgi:hypothetical protein
MDVQWLTSAHSAYIEWTSSGSPAHTECRPCEIPYHLFAPVVPIDERRISAAGTVIGAFDSTNAPAPTAVESKRPNGALG